MSATGTGAGSPDGKQLGGGPTAFGKLVFVLGLLALMGYHVTAALLEIEPSSVGTWLPIGVMGIGLTMIVWDLMTDSFEESMPSSDT